MDSPNAPITTVSSRAHSSFDLSPHLTDSGSRLHIRADRSNHGDFHPILALKDDQIRDWSIALGPFTVPLVGPATSGMHDRPGVLLDSLGDSIVRPDPGLTTCRTPGGIGRRWCSPSPTCCSCSPSGSSRSRSGSASPVPCRCVTASYDLCLAPLVESGDGFKPREARDRACVLLEWHRGSTMRVAATAAIARGGPRVHRGVFVPSVS